MLSSLEWWFQRFFIWTHLGKWSNLMKFGGWGKKGQEVDVFFLFGVVATVFGDERWEEMLYVCVGHRHQSKKRTCTLQACGWIETFMSGVVHKYWVLEMWVAEIFQFFGQMHRKFLYKMQGSNIDALTCSQDKQSLMVLLGQVWKSHCLFSSKFKLKITHLFFSGWGLMPHSDLVLALLECFFS